MKFLKSLFASANRFALDSETEEPFSEQWSQIEIYYEILSQTFQASESGNLEPIKSNSKILVAKAERFSIENMPASYRSPKIIETLLKLKKQTNLVNELVEQNMSDDEIKLALTNLQRIFRLIVEQCLTNN